MSVGEEWNDDLRSPDRSEVVENKCEAKRRSRRTETLLPYFGRTRSVSVSSTEKNKKKLGSFGRGE